MRFIKSVPDVGGLQLFRKRNGVAENLEMLMTGFPAGFLKVNSKKLGSFKDEDNIFPWFKKLFTYCLEEWRRDLRISSPGSKFAPRGEVKNGPLATLDSILRLRFTTPAL
jgi:hypothetical protein